jgi:hypothetical protein
MIIQPSHLLRNLVDAIRQYKNNLGDYPEVIIMHPRTHEYQYLSLTGLMGIRVVVSQCCPEDKVYLITEEQRQDILNSIQTSPLDQEQARK